MTDFLIRAAKARDLVCLARIERDAAGIFPPDVLPISARGVLPLTKLQAALEHACLWVAELAGGEVIGFVLAEACARSLHIEEMDVAPAHMRRGVGAQLLRTLRQVASARGHHNLTLTTFAHIPWNAPFYRKHGFVQVHDFEQFPHLERALQAEQARGLQHRIAMVRDMT